MPAIFGFIRFLLLFYFFILNFIWKKIWSYVRKTHLKLRIATLWFFHSKYLNCKIKKRHRKKQLIIIIFHSLFQILSIGVGIIRTISFYGFRFKSQWTYVTLLSQLTYIHSETAIKLVLDWKLQEISLDFRINETVVCWMNARISLIFKSVPSDKRWYRANYNTMW